MWVMDADVEIDGVDEFDVDHAIGVDGDLIAGYDFGLVRAELEGVYKWGQA